MIAVLLRFMDSFMIYTEPFVVTGGGPGNATTFLSIDLVKLALGQFDLGKAAAMSIVYNLIILTVCWVFYTVMTTRVADARRAGGAACNPAAPAPADGMRCRRGPSGRPPPRLAREGARRSTAARWSWRSTSCS
jgi:glycerol transport system permease protein